MPPRRQQAVRALQRGDRERVFAERYEKRIDTLFPNLVDVDCFGNWLPMINHCIDVIEFLCFESGNILWHEDHQQQEVKSLIHGIRMLTGRIEKELWKIWEESEQ